MTSQRAALQLLSGLSSEQLQELDDLARVMRGAQEHMAIPPPLLSAPSCRRLGEFLTALLR